MKRIIIALVLISITSPAYTGEALSNKAMFFEFGGAGIAASLNYEQKIWMKNHHAFALRGGLGYFPLIMNTKPSAGTYSLILGANYKSGLNNHGITFGISNAFAGTIANGISDNFKTFRYSHLIIPNMGYRYQKPQKHKPFAEIGYSPIISYDGLSIENNMLQFKNHFYLSIGLNL